MIVYVTRPNNHELVMGGWRSVNVWLEKPSFYHTPKGGFTPLRDFKKSVCRDIGWAVEYENRSLKFKPIVKQDPALEQAAWDLIAWSACPQGVTLEGYEAWGNARPEAGCEYTNWENLMWHRAQDSDLAANVHYKRFLMSVNLKTNECKLLVPEVHIFRIGQPLHNPASHEKIETQNISVELATRTYYECPELEKDIPF